MFITVHAAAATILGKEIASPILAFLAGLISHFILDMIPHGDENLGKKFLGFVARQKEDFRILALYGSIDSFFLAIFLIFLFKNFEQAKSLDSMALAIIGSILPDLLVAIYKLTKVKALRGFSEMHLKIHHLVIKKASADVPLKFGVLMQLCFLICLIWLIYFF